MDNKDACMHAKQGVKGERDHEATIESQSVAYIERIGVVVALLPLLPHHLPLVTVL